MFETAQSRINFPRTSSRLFREFLTDINEVVVQPKKQVGRTDPFIVAEERDCHEDAARNS